jgi:hypothetical protein
MLRGIVKLMFKRDELYFVSMLNDASVELDNTLLGEDYEDGDNNIDDGAWKTTRMATTTWAMAPTTSFRR